jgi:three-Cys-motif partner protein
MKSLDVFLNFPVADMNRNVFWRDPEGVDQSDVDRMNFFWGDDSWRKIVYKTNKNLFGFPEKEPNEVVAEAFRQRLKDAAGFNLVPEPLPMRNSIGAIVYYLFFASQNETAARIARVLFNRHRLHRSR